MKIPEPTDTKSICYYADLICQKIDLHVDGFLKRMEALKKGDREGAEFIEETMLKPLERQKTYLATKLQRLTQGWR